MSKRFIIFFLLSFLAFTADCFSQAEINKNKLVGKSFWTKFVLAIESACKIEITPNDISLDEEYCRFDSHIDVNTKITLKSLSENGKWTKVSFENEKDKDEFEVFLKNDSKDSFWKSFNLAFSDTKLSEDDEFRSCDVSNKLDIIKKLGFPTTVSRKGENEKWVFDHVWIGGLPCNYDVTYIEIKNGKVVDITGLI